MVSVQATNFLQVASSGFNLCNCVQEFFVSIRKIPSISSPNLDLVQGGQVAQDARPNMSHSSNIRRYAETRSGEITLTVTLPSFASNDEIVPRYAHGIKSSVAQSNVLVIC